MRSKASQVMKSCKRSANIHRSIVSTLDALYRAMNLAPRVLSVAPGSASTEENALCLVLRRAIAFLAARGALKNCHADISVHQYVANYVQWTTVMCVPVNRKIEWISSR
jgi:hypothetical protein